MPLFSYNASGTTQQSIGGDELNYDANGTIEAKDAEDAKKKVRAIKVGVKSRTHDVSVRPKN